MKNLLLFALVSLIALGSCNRIKPVKTVENLKAGIRGELTAGAKYAAFASKAKAEGNNTIAKLFEAASRSESIHAANHTKVLESLGEKIEDFTPQFDVKTTEENLRSALEGEAYEATNMYPQFLEDAVTENVEKAKTSFSWAYYTEKKHKEFYAKYLNALQTNTANNLPSEYAVCPVCGNTYEKALVDDKCAFCLTSNKRFIRL